MFFSFILVYDFKLRGHDVLRGRYLELLPPLLRPPLDPMSKTCYNFFSIARILSKNVLVRKNIQFVYYPEHYVSLFPRKLYHIQQKICFFYVKKAYFLRIVMRFCGKQTNQQNVLENRQTECFFLPQNIFRQYPTNRKKL